MLILIQKHNFIGKEALIKIKNEGIKRKQVGIRIDSDPLQGPNTTFWPLVINQKQVGKVTSAVYSPRLKKNIALAMINVENSNLGNKVEVITSYGLLNAKIIEKPFYDANKKVASA